MRISYWSSDVCSSDLVAASVIGIRPVYAKLTAFAVSSFIIGVAGALWAYIHLGSWEPLAFDLNRSLQLLFIVIIGGLGSIVGSFFGAAFMVLLPVLLTNVPHMLGLSLAVDTASHIEHMVFGALIVFFLIVEPPRSDARRAGKECARTCSSRWSPYY